MDMVNPHQLELEPESLLQHSLIPPKHRHLRLRHSHPLNPRHAILKEPPLADGRRR